MCGHHDVSYSLRKAMVLFYWENYLAFVYEDSIKMFLCKAIFGKNSMPWILRKACIMNALLMRESDTKWISEPIIWAFTSYKSIILEGRGAIFELE